YVSQFNERISALANEWKMSIQGVTDLNFRNAITDQYNQAMQALRDGAKNLMKEREKAKDANFGKTGKGDKKTEADVYEDLSKALKKVQADTTLAFGDRPKKQIDAY